MVNNNFETNSMDLPYNIEAEQSVLGSIIIDPECINIVLQYIKEADVFYTPQHKKLFDCVNEMYHYGTAIDIITLAEQTVNKHIFNDLPAANEYLAHIASVIPTTANIDGYCKIIVDKYLTRKIMVTANDIISLASENNDALNVLEVAEQRLSAIRQDKDTSSLVHVQKVVMDYYDYLGSLTSADRADHMAISTGFRGLDSIITGLNKSDLILIAGRPGMGKTSFGINIATNVAFKKNKEVAIFSLEMSNEQLVSRILSSRANIKSEKFRVGDLGTEEWIALSIASDELSRQQIYLDDAADITVGQMKAKLKRIKNLGLVIIDYLQLMTSGQRSENRVQEISQITRSLKIMAKELNVPVVLLSQLSRATEQRQGNKPMLSDLRESGSIEQDADIVMFLYREGYYNKECEYPNLAKCIIAKNRHGAVADTDLMWNGEITTFTDAEFIRDEQY